MKDFSVLKNKMHRGVHTGVLTCEGINLHTHTHRERDIYIYIYIYIDRYIYIDNIHYYLCAYMNDRSI